MVIGVMLNVLEGLHHQASRRITGMTATCGARGGGGVSPGGGGTESRGTTPHKEVHYQAAGDHSGKGGIPTHL